MANLKNTEISGDQFRLPVGDTAARPGSPEGREIRFNTETGKLEQFRPDVGEWITPANTGVIATGGDSVYDVDAEGTTYRVHVFTDTGNSSFSVSQGGEVEYLIVAGGGGGGNHPNASTHGGGGGGAGGVLTGRQFVNSNSYTVTIGDGGNEISSSTNGNSGDDSSVFGLTAIGGGGGGQSGSINGLSGGSGGGAGGGTAAGSGTPGQGNDGGTTNTTEVSGGGGGGAGAPGGDSTGEAGDGGAGISSLITGTINFYAGGGGGGRHANFNKIASGGLGGGGRGGGQSSDRIAVAGTPNTGAGGGGGNDYDPSVGAAGGSGIVIIRYPLRQENPVSADGKVVGDCLVLDLDFAKPTVYAGSGSTINDSRLGPGTGNIQGSFNYVNRRTHRSAFEFDYSTVFIPLGGLENFEFTQGITLNFWHFNGGGTGSYRGVATNGIPGQRNGGFDMRYGRENYFGGTNNGTNLGWRIRTPNEDQDLLSMNAPVGEWHMYTGTYDNSVQRVYVDGEFFDSSTHSTGGQLKTMPGDITIGRSPGTGEYLDGTLALVEIYARPLSEVELTQKFEATRWRFGI
jgi:hypothetical protein